MSERKRIVATAEAPAAIGPYSQAVVAGGFVFASGQIALDPVAGQLVAGDAAVQARRCLDNLRAVLAAAGAGLEDVVKTTVYLVDLADFEGVNRVYGEYFSQSPPARATVQVSRLPRDSRVEIEAVARMPGG